MTVLLCVTALLAGSARGAPKTVEPRLHVFERACLATRADPGEIAALASAEGWQVLPPDVTGSMTPIAGVRVEGWALPGSPLQETLLVSARSARVPGLKTCAIQFWGDGARAFDDALMNGPSSTLVGRADGPETWTKVYRLHRADGSMGVIVTAGRSFFGSFTVTAHEIRK